MRHAGSKAPHANTLMETDGDKLLLRGVPDRAVGTIEELMEVKAPNAGTQIGIED